MFTVRPQVVPPHVILKYQRGNTGGGGGGGGVIRVDLCSVLNDLHREQSQAYIYLQPVGPLIIGAELEKCEDRKAANRVTPTTPPLQLIRLLHTSQA